MYMIEMEVSKSSSSKQTIGNSGGSKGGCEGYVPPRAQILSISCSFWENLAKSYVGAPSAGKSWIRHWETLPIRMETNSEPQNKTVKQVYIP